jgi:hypothetical protein
VADPQGIATIRWLSTSFGSTDGKVAMVPDDLTEDQIDDLPLESVMAVEVLTVHERMVKRLTALPYPAYLQCMASYMEDLCTYYGTEIFGEGERLVRKTIDLVRAAADGQSVAAPEGTDAGRLEREWLAYMGNPGFDDEDFGDMVETDLPTLVDWICTHTVDELTDPEYRYYAAEVAADAAFKARRQGEPPLTGDSIRLLLKFFARAKGTGGEVGRGAVIEHPAAPRPAW